MYGPPMRALDALVRHMHAHVAHDLRVLCERQSCNAGLFAAQRCLHASQDVIFGLESVFSDKDAGAPSEGAAADQPLPFEL